MESPNKRRRQSPPDPGEAEADFVSLSVEDDEAANQYGYDQNGAGESQNDEMSAPRGPRAMYQQPRGRDSRSDPRHAKDRPKSKHALPGYEPWILVKTKFGRRFVHNGDSGESFWRIPAEVIPGVKEFDALDKQQKEKDANAKWAEDQLKQMRTKPSQTTHKEAEKDDDRRGRRRRSESLQKEDEAALMAELAAEAEHAEENDAKQAAKTVEPLQPKTVHEAEGAYGSDSSYEEVEVTDSEGEEEEPPGQATQRQDERPSTEITQKDTGPMEFGEDDIAYQLAAMEQDYGDEEGYDDEVQEGEEYYEDEEPETTGEEAAAIFRAMLDDHRINPFTPWEKLIADESDTGIILDDRYTALPNMRSRKAVWEAWVKDTAARLKEERAKAETLDPKVPYLAFLAEKASPKLYWPEFKRKYRKESVLNDRKLSDKDRERLYRDHINRLKLPEKTRKADLIALLKSVPLRDLNKGSTSHDLPQQLLSNLHFISLPISTRDDLISNHIKSLPSASDKENGELSDERPEDSAKQRKQEEALRARERQVEEERKKAAQTERWARKDLKEEEREIERAMDVGKSGLRGQLAD